jgi:hypothetical protein
MEKTPCLKLSLCVGVLVGCERTSLPERQRPTARFEAARPRSDHARFVNSAGQVRRLALSGLLADDTWPSLMSAKGSFEPSSPKEACRR